MKARPQYETPPHLTISITDTCNLACRWCYGDCGSRAKSSELAAPEWLNFLDYLEAHGFIQVYFEGGEPFLRPDFLRILESATPRFMTLVRTHGTLIDARLARRLRELNVGRVLVDLCGSHAATHDYMTGTPGSFDQACAGIRHLAKAGVKTDALVILNRRSAPELQEIAALAKRLGAQRLGVLRLYPLGRARRHWKELALGVHEQEAAIAALRMPAGLELMQSWHPHDRNCCWQAAAVTASGDSVGCMYLREYVRFGNIRETTLLDTWKTHPLYRYLRIGVVESSCAGCNEDDGSHGGCRSTAYAFTGRWEAPDPFCSHSNHGIDIRAVPPDPLPPVR